MNELELTILVLSAFLHDIGMVVARRERNRILRSEDFKHFEGQYPRIAKCIKEAQEEGEHRIATELEDQLLTYFLRESHASRGAQFVRRKFGACLKLGDLDFSEVVCRICASHNEPWEKLGARKERVHGYPLREEYPTSHLIGTYEVSNQFLAIVLRLADILDFDRERTPSVIFEYLYPLGEVSLSHWLTHFSVQGWLIDKDKIKFRVECEHPLYQKTVNEYFDKIDAELQGAHLLIERFPTRVAEQYKMRLPVAVDRSEVGPKMIEGKPSYIYADFHFGLDYDRVVTLLSEELHYDETTTIRELLQNSIDACRYRCALETATGSAWKEDDARIAFVYDSAKSTLVVDDNGIGMDQEIVEKYFLRIGCSYYREENPRYLRDIALFRSKGVNYSQIARFGIGFMSTFMLADKIEVKTRRKEHDRLGIPLCIKIDPRLKMYVMKELEPFEWPKGNQPGTTMILHLTKSIELKDLLDKFAVNIELNLSANIDGRHYMIKPKGFGVECFPNLVKEVQYHIKKGQLTSYAINLSKSGIPSVKGTTTFFFPSVRGKLLLPKYDTFDYGSLEMQQEFLIGRRHPKTRVLNDTKLTSEGILVEHSSGIDLPFPQISVIDFFGDSKPELTLDRKSFRHGSFGSGYIENKLYDFLSSEFGKSICGGNLKFFSPFWKFPWDMDKDLLEFLVRDPKARNDLFSFPLILGRKLKWFTFKQIREQFQTGIFVVFKQHKDSMESYKDEPDFFGNYSRCPPHLPLVGLKPSYKHNAEYFWKVLFLYSAMTLVRSGSYYYLRLKLRDSIYPEYSRMKVSSDIMRAILTHKFLSVAQYDGFPTDTIYSQNFALALNEKHPLVQVYIKCVQTASSEEEIDLVNIFRDYLINQSARREEQPENLDAIGRRLLKQGMIKKSDLKILSNIPLRMENMETSHLFSDPEPQLVQPKD
jgi:hypothetical protein